MIIRCICDRVFSLRHCSSYSTRRSAVWIRLWRRMAICLLRVRFVHLISSFIKAFSQFPLSCRSKSFNQGQERKWEDKSLIWNEWLNEWWPHSIYRKSQTPLHGHRLRTPATNTTNEHHQRTKICLILTSWHVEMLGSGIAIGKFVVE